MSHPTTPSQAPHVHEWQHEKSDAFFLAQRCPSCGLFRIANRSRVSQMADEIVGTYQRRGYRFLDDLEKKYEPKWTELTLEEIGKMVQGHERLGGA